jgi:DNA-binding NarL/FixJ family response regulator
MQLAILDKDPQSRRQIRTSLEMGTHAILLESDSPEKFALELDRHPNLDLLLMGISPTNTQVFSEVKSMQKMLPGVAIFIYTEELNQRVLFPAVRAGVKAFFVLSDPASSLLCGIDAIERKQAYLSPTAAGSFISGLEGCTFNLLDEDFIQEYDFSPREKRVMELLLASYSYKEIGAELHVSINTVRYYIKNIYRTLDVSSRKELMRKIKSL